MNLQQHISALLQLLHNVLIIQKKLTHIRRDAVPHLFLEFFRDLELGFCHGTGHASQGIGITAKRYRATNGILEVFRL